MNGRVVSVEVMVGKEESAALKAELEAVVAKFAALSLSTSIRPLQPGHTWNLEFSQFDANADLNGWMRETEIWEAFQQKLTER